MIEVIVKRNGNKEEFNPKKLNGWGIWASKALGNYVDWSEVVLHVASTLSTEVTSEKLQQALIDFCLSKSSWSYNRMAGRLYAALLYKQLYNDNIPTVKDLFGKMVNEGVMDNKFYTAFTDEDYKQLELVIDHKRDLNYAHYQINQAVKKYALMNRSASINYETPQFSMLRTAMRMCMNKGVGVERISRIKRHYDQYSKDKVNVPTPYYTNSGTPKNGFQSCCLHHTNNTVGSLSASDHISYMMTVSSAGQGNKVYTQSIGSAVRGGTIIHQGKTPYYRAQVAMINANLQNGRGGAETQSYDVYDPEIESIQKMKNPMTPAARQVRGLDYAMCFNLFFANKAANNELYALFDYKDTEDLYKAMALEDVTVFEKLYGNYIALGKAIKFVNARDILYGALSEAVETGRHYLTNLTEMNRHTPFKESIFLSNLCVAPETQILTDKGYKVISDLEGEDVNVWNGKEWSEVKVVKTGENQELIKVTLSKRVNNGEFTTVVIRATTYHKWYNYNKEEIRTFQLYENLPLTSWVDEDGNVTEVFVDKLESSEVDNTYCFSESKRGMGVFNGVLTGQCAEISLTTKAYDSVDQLYEEKESGEVAMCSLAGINVGRINSDEEYKEAAWVALDMIHTGITESDYILPQVGFTAKKRMSAGVGIVDLAYAMAKRKLKYSSQEGRDFIHETAESHYWFLLDASLELAKEFGNAEWIGRTKWVDGWLPLDTYNKNINSVVTVENERDWESMRKRIKDNKGHAFSVLAAHMPAESSSIKSGATNSLYPVRDLDLTKSNDTNVVTYVVPESEKFGKHYEIAWDIDVEDMAKVYGIVQKWTDQAISADMWYSAVGSNKISSDDLMRGFFSWIKYGVKTRYYVNTKTAKGIDLNSSEPVELNGEFQPESNSECEGCQL